MKVFFRSLFGHSSSSAEMNHTLSKLSLAKGPPLFTSQSFTSLHHSCQHLFSKGQPQCGGCWGNVIKNECSSQPGIRFHKGSRERKQFYYWLCTKLEHNTYHRQSAKRLQRLNDFSPFTVPSRYKPLHTCSQDNKQSQVSGSDSIICHTQFILWLRGNWGDHMC